MALRLAGEPFLALQGADAQGWLREITIQDALPGLKINQQGSGRVFDFQDGGASKLYLPAGGNVTLAGSLVLATANPITITPSNPAAARTLTIPAVAQGSTFAFLEQAQAFSAIQTFTAAPVVDVNVTSAAAFTVRSGNPNGTNPFIVFEDYANGNTNAKTRFRKARGASASSPIAIVTGDILGQFMFDGYDGSAFQTGADIYAASTGTIASGRVPAYLVFRTTPDTASPTLTERWRITEAGDLKATGGNLDLNSKNVNNGVLGTALNLNGQSLTGGGTFTGAMTFSAKPAITVSVSAQGFINVPIATASPTAPANGDVWVEDIGGVRKLAVRIGGITYAATLT